MSGSGDIGIAAVGVDTGLVAALGVVPVCGDAIAQTFDESSHTWPLQVPAGPARARIVVSGAPPETGLRPYRGVAVHGRPNWFFVTDPEQAAYVRDCLAAIERECATRIEVRYSTQRVFDEHPGPWPTGRRRRRQLRRRIVEDFDLSSGAGVSDEIYDGPATLHRAGGDLPVRVRLTGHLDPIDGRYHWQGIILDADDTAGGPVALTVGDRTADARITERTAQGTFSIAGVGAPPFALADVEVSEPC